MSGLGMALVGWASRCAVVGLVASGLVAWWSRRSGPASAAMAARAGLLGLLLMPALAAIDWPGIIVPDWTSTDPKAASPEPSEPAGVRDRPIEIGPPAPAPVGGPSGRPVSAPRPVSASIEPPRPSPGPVDRPRREPTHPSRRFAWPSWSSWLATMAVAGWLVGASRMAAGLVALGRLRRSARVVDDPSLLAEVAEIRRAIGLRRRVAVVESPAVGAPATFGWSRPCVVLPEGWRGWTEDERRAVLAHELAHVQGGDFAGRITARACLVVHFYHPVAHWLASRLALHQELAADAWGVRLAGGRSRYLKALALLALRLDAGPGGGQGLDGVVLAFGGGGFLRRMEMLNRENGTLPVESAPSWRSRGATLALVAAVAVGASALRAGKAPAEDREVPATGKVEAEVKAGSGPEARPFDLTHVPSDAVALVGFRPSSILAEDEVRPFRSLMQEYAIDLFPTLEHGLAPEGIEQVLYAQLPTDLDATLDDPIQAVRNAVLIVRTARPFDAEALAKALAAVHKKKVPTKETVANKGYFKVEVDKLGAFGLLQPDDRTVLVAAEPILRRLIEQPTKPGGPRPWDEAWKAVERCQFAVAIDVDYARSLVAPLLLKEDSLDLLMFSSPLAPIWDGSRGMSVGLQFEGDQVLLRSLNTSRSVEAAERTLRTVQAIQTLGRNASSSIRRQSRRFAMTNKDAGEVLLYAKTVDLWAEKAMEGMKVARDGRTVEFSARLDLDMLTLLLGFFK
jgi:hypothetical protein